MATALPARLPAIPGLSDASVAPPARWSGAVRRLPAGVPLARGSARLLLRPRQAAGCRRAHDVWPLERLLHRSDREEAPGPFPARQRGPELRHGRLQSGLSLLPELGHLQVPRVGHARRHRLPRRHRGDRGANRLPERRLHLQRPGHLPRVRHRRGRGVPRAGHPYRGRHGRLRQARCGSGAVRGHGCRERGPQGVRRGDVSDGLLRAPGTGARDAGGHRRRGPPLAGDHDAADPRPERLRHGDRRADALGRGATRPIRAAPLHGLPPRLQDARPACDPRHDPLESSRHRPGQRASLRLHGQHPRSRGPEHLLSCAAGRASSVGTATASPPGPSTPGGRCRTCGARCAGVFEAGPGRWGARRQPITIASG